MNKNIRNKKIRENRLSFLRNRNIHFMRLLVLGFLFVFGQSCLNGSQKLKDRPTIARFGTSTTFAESTPSPTGTETAPQVERPTGHIFINKDFCSCLESKADILNNCISYCANKAVKVPTLFVSTSLGPDVELNPDLGSLYNWCKKEIRDGKTNPGCQLEAWDGADRILMDVTIPVGSNSFTADISLLARNTTYVMTLVETGSGSLAKSASFQLRRVILEEDGPILGPLRITPVHQYICINRTLSPETNPVNGTTNENFLKAVKRHFYFSAANQPPSLPPGDHRVFCHDINLFGLDDGPLFPRLGISEQVFNLWNETDIRFYDQDANKKLDVNDLIIGRLAEEYGLKTEQAIFTKFEWPNYPGITSGATGSEASADVVPVLGYYMLPSVDRITQKSFCPRKEHFNSDIPLLRILKELVGVNTEALYFAQKEPESFTDSSGTVQTAPTDLVLIREGLLKKIWFYIEKGLHVVPNEVTSTTRTIMVYWPPDTTYPHVKKASQKVYLIKHPSQLGSTAGNEDFRQGVTPPDKRFACIPSRE